MRALSHFILEPLPPSRISFPSFRAVVMCHGCGVQTSRVLEACATPLNVLRGGASRKKFSTTPPEPCDQEYLCGGHVGAGFSPRHESFTLSITRSSERATFSLAQSAEVNLLSLIPLRSLHGSGN